MGMTPRGGARSVLFADMANQLGRDAVITALKALTKAPDWDTPEGTAAFTKSLWGENDRGAIILSASSIELTLERQIKRQMPHLNSEERSYLFDFNGPVGTFSSKIRIANAIGIIGRQIYRKIDLVREMRNACAHSREPISFQTPAIYNAVICLTHDLRMTPPDKDDNGSIRNIFIIATLYLGIAATGTSPDVSHQTVLNIMRQPLRDIPPGGSSSENPDPA